MASSPADRSASTADLLASDPVLRALSDALHEGLVLLDRNGYVESCNPAAAQIIGVPGEALVGRRLADVVPAEREDGSPIPDAQRATARVLAGGEGVTDALVRVPRPDGTTAWLRVNTRPLYDASETRLAGALVSFVDVTDLRTSLHQARNAEARFRKMVAKASDMVVVTDDGGILTYVSPAAMPMLGFDETEKLGTNVFDLIHPDDAAKALERFLCVTNEHAEPQPLELRIIDARGGWRPIEVLASNLLDDADVHGIVVNVRDVTERHRTEAALEEVQQRFRAAFEHAPLGVAFVALDRSILQVNRAYCDMTGFAPEELIGTDATRLVVVDEDTSEPVGTGGRRWTESGRELQARRRDGSPFWAFASWSLISDEQGEPSYAIVVVADVTSRKELEAQLAHDARHDALTGLMNRSCFLEHLEHALARARRDPRSVAVLFLDLDRFKLVNDTLGHDAGDELLVEVAHRLRSSARASDTVARLGGDEFVVLCEGVESTEQVAAAAERIRAAVEAPMMIRGRLFYVGASIGIAIAQDHHVAADLMRNSDVAVYRAKARGRSRSELFDEEMSAEDDLRLEIEVELRRALACGEIAAWYQPVVDVRTGDVVAFEALARWLHPTRGVLEPPEFMQVAEETGLVNQLGLIVIEAACRQEAAWGVMLGRRRAGMSVNLSPRQLENPDLVPSLRRVFAETGVVPADLCFEVNETCVMRDVDNALEVLGQLRALGVGLAIDDFGTGQSSLNSLRRLPIDVVKLDQSFVFDLGLDTVGSKIVAAVVDLAHAVSLEVVAEGVESAEHLEALVELGCDLAQGWFLAPALDAEDATRVACEGIGALRAHTWRALR